MKEAVSYQLSAKDWKRPSGDKCRWAPPSITFTAGGERPPYEKILAGAGLRARHAKPIKNGCKPQQIIRVPVPTVRRLLRRPRRYHGQARRSQGDGRVAGAPRGGVLPPLCGGLGPGPPPHRGRRGLRLLDAGRPLPGAPGEALYLPPVAFSPGHPHGPGRTGATPKPPARASTRIAATRTLWKRR